MTSNLFTRARRAVAALAIAAPALVGGATPAGALATASVVDNGNGSITVTYAGAVAGQQGHNVVVAFRDPSTTCALNFNPYVYVMDALGTSNAPLASSPAVVTAGTLAGPAGSPNPVPIVDGIYRVCVIVYDYSNQQNDSVVGDLVVTIGNPQASAPNPSTPQVPPAYTG